MRLLALIFLLTLLSGPAAAETQITILAFGDSLVAGNGVAADKTFPAQLEARLKAEDLPVRVINGGNSGETSAGGVQRIATALDRAKPDAVILVLGGNDMLRAIDPAATRENLGKILDVLKARRLPVLLAGMRAHERLGPSFDAAYVKMYKELAQQYGAIYYPFFLEGVAQAPELNLTDGVHPNAEGFAVIVTNMLSPVADLLLLATGARP
jgi:acyl-CoA thioesterase I